MQRTYDLMVPEPRGPELQELDTSAFFSTPIPKAFIFETLDHSLSTDTSAWLLFSDRLAQSNNANVSYQVCSLTGIWLQVGPLSQSWT